MTPRLWQHLGGVKALSHQQPRSLKHTAAIPAALLLERLSAWPLAARCKRRYTRRCTRRYTCRCASRGEVIVGLVQRRGNDPLRHSHESLRHRFHQWLQGARQRLVLENSLEDLQLGCSFAPGGGVLEGQEPCAVSAREEAEVGRDAVEGLDVAQRWLQLCPAHLCMRAGM